MNYYKDPLTGEVYAYDDQQVAGGVVKEWLTPLTQLDIDAHINPLPTQAQLVVLGRAWRDAELLKADIEVSKAADTARATEPAWRRYREALRQWPQSGDFPDTAGRPKTPAGDAS